MSLPQTQSSLARDLHDMGLSAGDGVFVHASMRAIGPVHGGAHSLISALFDVVGQGGLIGMPGFSDDAYPPADIDVQEMSPEEIAQRERAVSGFDVDQSPTSEMGVIAETFRTWPGTKRSAHPTTSVCLNGRHADQLIEPHAAPWATGASSPFGRLRARSDMKVLLLGVGWHRCTVLHTAEASAIHRRLKTRRFKSGPGDALWYETPDVADDLGRLFPLVGEAFVATGRVTRGMIGNAQALLCGYDDLISFASQWIDAENARSGARL